MSVERLVPGVEMHRLCAGSLPWAGCFHCGEEVNGIAVVWAGSIGPIALHPTCAYELSHELIGDVRNAIRLIEGKPLTAGIGETPT